MTRDPFAPVTIVIPSDKVFEKSTDEDRAKYRRTLDPSALKAVDGTVPIQVEIVPADAIFAMRHFGPSPDAAMLAFRACVRSVRMRDGVAIKPKGLDDMQLADEDWLRTMSKLLGNNRVLEVGYMAMSISNLSPESLDPLSLSPGAAPTS